MNIGTKYAAQVIIAASTNSSALAAVPPLTSPPVNVGTGATQSRAVIDCRMATQVHLQFAGTAAQNKDYPYQVHGVRHLSGLNVWPTEKVATGSATLGNCSIAGLMANGLVADTITNTVNNPLATVFSPANDTPATLTIDVSGFEYLLVDVSTSGASAAPTTMCVISSMTSVPSQQAPVFAGEVNLGNVGILNAAETEINPATEDTLAATTVSATGNAGNGALADVGTAITVSGKGKLSVTVKNTSDTAMTDFALLIQAHTTADFITLLSGADWATVSDVLRFSGLSATSQYANALAAGEKVTLILNLGAPYAIKFQAQSSAASKTLTIYGTAGR